MTIVSLAPSGAHAQAPAGSGETLSPYSVVTEQRETLTGGWDVRPPYSFMQDDSGVRRWVGLDVDLLREISTRAGYVVTAQPVKRAQHIEGMRAGEYDIAAQATMTPERATYARFSIPYRHKTIALIVPKGRSRSLRAKGIGELIQSFKNSGFRLGIESGVAYPSRALDDFINSPLYQFMIFRLSAPELVARLLNGEIDGFFIDRILGAHLTGSLGVADVLEEHPVMVQGDLHLMFNKTSVPPEVVRRFNEAIKSVQEDGTYRRLNAKYTFPILLRLTLDNDWWFKAVDIVGTIAFAMSGLLLAFRYKYDVFGAFVLASLPAVGGGVARDLITNRGKLAVLASPIYLEIVTAMVVGGYLALRVGVLIRKRMFRTVSESQGKLLRLRAPYKLLRLRATYMVQVFDAVGLAAFTVTGVVVAVATHSNPLWIWGPILAALTASGGGILRDVVRSDPEIPALKGELYPEIAIAWGLILSLYFLSEHHHLEAKHIQFGALATFSGAFITRMITIHAGLKSPRFSR